MNLKEKRWLNNFGKLTLRTHFKVQQLVLNKVIESQDLE